MYQKINFLLINTRKVRHVTRFDVRKPSSSDSLIIYFYANIILKAIIGLACTAVSFKVKEFS